jgi:uncharacterized protein YjiS (DUF1127 family)
MAYAHIGFAPFDKSGLKARYRQIRDTLDQRATRRAIYRRTMKELHALSDRDLADFGFHRSEIPRISKEAAELT